MHDPMPGWLLVPTWIGVGFIVLVALVTLVRAPGRKQDPGRFDTGEETEPAGRSTWARVDRGADLDYEDRRVPSVGSLPGSPDGFLLCAQSTELFLTLDGGDTFAPLGSTWPDEHARPDGVFDVRIDRV